MTISMYQASVPLINRALTNLREILVKAEAHAQAKKIDPSVFLNGRLAPDMLPLTKQIQIVSDNAKGIPARLAGVEIPAYADTEASFAELIARLDKTLAFVATLTPSQIDGSESRKVELKLGPNTVPFTGLSYLTGFALPNLYFHVVTAYAILRHLGVEIGKRDYIGNPQ